MGQLQQIQELNLNQAVRVYCLGTFRIYRPDEDKALGIISKHKMWLLTKYLIVNRGTTISTSNIIERIWPEQKDMSDTAALRTTISRLKAIISSNNKNSKPNNSSLILYRKESCALNPNCFYWLDVDVFEKLCFLGHQLGKSNRQAGINTYLEAMELYQGDFLIEDYDLEWTVSTREYFRRLFLDSVVELVLWLIEAKDYSQANIFLEKAIRFDPYSEKLNSLMIRVLYETGAYKRAKEWYSEYSRLLYHELKVQPCSELKQLYHQIIQAEREISSTELVLNGDLQIPVKNNGPFICEPDLFFILLQIEKRRTARVGQAFMVIFEENDPPNPSISQKLLKNIKTIAEQILRKSDIVCLLDNSHLVLLLTSTDCEGAKKVTENLIQKYNQRFGTIQFKSLKLRYKKIALD